MDILYLLFLSLYASFRPCSIVLDVILELWNATTGCTLRLQLLIRTRFFHISSFETLLKFPEKKCTSIFLKGVLFLLYIIIAMR